MSQNLSPEETDQSVFAKLLLDPEGDEGESAEHLALLKEIFVAPPNIEHGNYDNLSIFYKPSSRNTDFLLSMRIKLEYTAIVCDT